MTKLTEATYVNIQEDQFDAGYHPEDGPGMWGENRILGSIFRVVVETPDGYRFAHSHTFSDGCHWEYNPDGSGDGGFVRDHEAGAKADAFAERIQAHLNAGGSLNPAHWTPIQGCYGSAGWDEQAEIDLERMEEEYA